MGGCVMEGKERVGWEGVSLDNVFVSEGG